MYDFVVLAQLMKEEVEKKNKILFWTSRDLVSNCCFIALLLHLMDSKSLANITMVVFRMLESIPSARYSSIFNVVCLLSTHVIPTYRIY